MKLCFCALCINVHRVTLSKDMQFFNLLQWDHSKYLIKSNILLQPETNLHAVAVISYWFMCQLWITFTAKFACISLHSKEWNSNHHTGAGIFLDRTERKDTVFCKMRRFVFCEQTGTEATMDVVYGVEHLLWCLGLCLIITLYNRIFNRALCFSADEQLVLLCCYVQY